MSEALEDGLADAHDKDESRAHIPVMLKEVLELLSPSAGEIMVDGTLGLAGHASEIGKHLGKTGHLIGIDQDIRAIAQAKQNLSGFEGRLDIIKSNFRDMPGVLDMCHVEKVDGILLDLGVSSLQLDTPERGFSFRHDGPLDMRMDEEGHVSAYELVNSLSEREISTLLRDYGQERFHQRIARFLVNARAAKPIETTKELSEIIYQATPGRFRHQRIHPATRSFQALRIAVNRELDSLEMVLSGCWDRLKIDGRFVIIAFHSLEDRIVKHTFRRWAKEQQGELLTKRPLRPTPEEEDVNVRARSARTRGIKRTI